MSRITKSIILIIVVASFVGAASALACGCAKTGSDKTSETKNTTAAKTYTCPMHPEVTSDKPGKCPKCGMNLVPKEEKGTEAPGGK